MKYVPRIFNIILVSVAMGLCSTLIARYWLSLGYSIAIGALVALASGSIILLFGWTGGGKKIREKHSTAVRTALLTMSQKKRKQFLLEVLRLSKNVVLNADGWTVTKDEKEEYFIDALRYRPLGGDDIIDYRSRYAEGKIIVFANSFDKSATEVANLLSVELLGWDKVYQYLDEWHAYPRIQARTRKKGQARRLLVLALHPRRVKAYLLTALVLLTTSIITPYRFYYIVLSCVCCLMAGVALADPLNVKNSS